MIQNACSLGSSAQDGSWERRANVRSFSPQDSIVDAHTNRKFNTDHVDVAIFDRISTYDPKQVCRRLASRKSEGTTEWLRTSDFFQEWLGPDRSKACLWFSGKGEYMDIERVTEARANCGCPVGSGKSTLM